MQKIRILVVVGSLRIGGQERVATSIIEYIDKEKFQVDYLVYDDIYFRKLWSAIISSQTKTNTFAVFDIRY